MNILILGYGKMGKIISEIAETRGHSISGKINIDNREELNSLDPSKIDVAIEFSQPEAAVENISWAMTRGIPVVSGTTGWLSRKSYFRTQWSIFLRFQLQYRGQYFFQSQ
jgi:4-hydroxy-tetrahydrodipicolinate reductase